MPPFSWGHFFTFMNIIFNHRQAQTTSQGHKYVVGIRLILEEVRPMSSLIASILYFFKESLFFMSYVKNQAFPNPLPPEEEAKQLQLMAEGSHEARNKLIEHNLRLVAHIVKKFENTKEDFEDLISIEIGRASCRERV